MITRIEAYRYRCFERLAVDLGRYQVLVGRNGAGKSTLVDIPVLLGEMLQKQDIHQALFRPTPSHQRPRADGGQDLVYNGSGGWFAFAVEAELPSAVAAKVRAAHIRYELAASVEGSGLELTQESVLIYDTRPSADALPAALWSQSQLNGAAGIRQVLTRERAGNTTLLREPRLRGPKPAPVMFEARAGAPALAFVPPDDDLYPACNWFRQHLRDQCLAYMPDLPRLRSAQPSPGKDVILAPDGTTLPWSILRLSTDTPRYEEWIMHVQSALPLVTKIDACQREDDKFAYVRVHYSNGLIVPSHGLSDGTLSILALSILPFLQHAPAIVAVEEPENGIHPKAIETVLESLTLMKGSQVFVTSHSPIVIAATDLGHLLCMSQSRSGNVEIVRGVDHPRLKEWKGKPDLSVLFSAGVL